MRIIVTGGSGMIGEFVVAELLRAGHTVTIVDQHPPRVPATAVQFHTCDLTDYAAAQSVINDADTVVHLAAIPNPANDPPERVLSVNTVSSFNVLEAVRHNGIRRVVYGCSESSSGFGIHNVNLKPLYLPIDEGHPCWPHETYSLSKRFGEEMLAWYARAYGFEGLALRYTWVWTARDAAGVRQIIQRSKSGEWDPSAWFGAYIAPHDVAQAVRLACAYVFPPENEVKFEPFYLSAADTFYPVPTLQVLKAIYGDVPPIQDTAYFESNPYIGVFDTRKAQRMLGYRATRGWRNYEEWGPA
ncbi:MAG: NAD-dependent epimerase/dehydratase family protein [Chloroflexi bacterium]|nr:NAD-dependent epimerase/dehydratase family protein [Chloroflexota bacterium]